MFDDQPQNTPSLGGAPHNLPVEPEDIFADVDAAPPGPSAPAPTARPTPTNALNAGMLKPKAAPEQAPMRPPAEPMKAPMRTDASPMPTITTPPRATAPTNGSDVHIEPTSYDTRQPIIGKLIVGIVALVAIGGLGFAGWWVYNHFVAPTPAIPVSPTPVTNSPSPSPVVTPEPTPTPSTLPVQTNSNSDSSSINNSINSAATTSAQVKNDELLFGQRLDSDNDGLDDVTEARLGTNPNNPDSDGDRLCDGDEVLIWKTDPLKPDTDGDGHVDGSEVYNGYNPLGPGKLGPLPAGVTTSTACQSAKKQ